MERQHSRARFQAALHRHAAQPRHRRYRRGAAGGVPPLLNLLAVETSCDETAAAVIRDGRTVVSSVVASQIPLHALHGGVVPELAARAHLEALSPTVDSALAQLEGGWQAIDAVAVTRGPGLPGCLLVGTSYAQAVAAARRLPITGVSHMAGHVYSAWLADPGLEPPWVSLVVSGGHTDCVEIPEHGRALRVASTRDDAAGEAFDKVGRMLGLPYPGGPAVERAAAEAGDLRVELPRTRIDGAFSFSGLKTAVRYTIRDLPPDELDSTGVPRRREVACAIAAAFQRAAVDQLVHGLDVAVTNAGAERISVVGGVAANRALRTAVEANFKGLTVVVPPMSLCTDNAAMI
ncbi:MAG: tRNA (adenosine(37)-N6)-threonylcarbamoyltransferase complex transferase subunit TsaD, partial [Candidatus Dormibacteria bacterium]